MALAHGAEHLPAPINSTGAEWLPRPGADGWLYFGSNRPGGLGGNDIWRGRLDSSGRWTVENLGAAVNTAGDEYDPLPAPNGPRMILMADGGLYQTHKTATGWTPRTKLGPAVNRNGTEIGPLFSPSGRSLLFARDTKGADSGEFSASSNCSRFRSRGRSSGMRSSHSVRASSCSGPSGRTSGWPALNCLEPRPRLSTYMLTTSARISNAVRDLEGHLWTFGTYLPDASRG